MRESILDGTGAFYITVLCMFVFIVGVFLFGRASKD